MRSRFFIAEEDADQYGQEVHPANQSFWKDLPKKPTHPLGRHPVLTLEGADLDRASYKHTREKAQRAQVNHAQLGQVFMQIMQHEAAHKKDLEKLAVRAVAKMMHVDESELEAQITRDVDVNQTMELDDQEKKDFPPHLLEEANKRITSNTFAQGASVHAYLTAHFFDEIESEIKKIDPELVNLYAKLASGSHHMYWMMDFPAMDLGNMAVGSVKPEYKEDKKLKVIAKSPMFIVLVQELVKGVMEIRYIQNLMESDLSDEDIKSIYRYADAINDEPHLIKVGPEVWRRFLKVVNSSKVKHKPIEVYAHLIKMTPKDVHDFVNLVVSKPEEASEKLQLLLEDKTTQWKEED